ncbi:MAG TPA: hypothetical protein VGR93_05220, partial [Candidatus Acidoferrales bacterium]|nr:hypothetical protein [Candidatus Acidoferrales bacterium]
AASAFDIETSQRCFREFPGRCVETNPILGQRRPRGYAVNEAFDFALAFGMHRARARSRVWWTPQIVPEAEHVALGIRNLRAHLTPMKCATSANITICSGGALQF